MTEKKKQKMIIELMTFYSHKNCKIVEIIHNYSNLNLYFDSFSADFGSDWEEIGKIKKISPSTGRQELPPATPSLAKIDSNTFSIEIVYKINS